jgi:hypothetical protein
VRLASGEVRKRERKSVVGDHAEIAIGARREAHAALGRSSTDDLRNTRQRDEDVHHAFRIGGRCDEIDILRCLRPAPRRARDFDPYARERRECSVKAPRFAQDHGTEESPCMRPDARDAGEDLGFRGGAESVEIAELPAARGGFELF